MKTKNQKRLQKVATLLQKVSDLDNSQHINFHRNSTLALNRVEKLAQEANDYLKDREYKQYKNCIIELTSIVKELSDIMGY